MRVIICRLFNQQSTGLKYQVERAVSSSNLKKNHNKLLAWTSLIVRISKTDYDTRNVTPQSHTNDADAVSVSWGGFIRSWWIQMHLNLFTSLVFNQKRSVHGNAFRCPFVLNSYKEKVKVTRLLYALNNLRETKERIEGEFIPLFNNSPGETDKATEGTFIIPSRSKLCTCLYQSERCS